MKNLDAINQKRTEILAKFSNAVQQNDTEAFAAVFAEFSECVQEAVMLEARGEIGAQDVSILAARGTRQLTSEENKYYMAVADAMRSANPRQALSELDVVMPKTVIDAVFEDLQQNHPLLDAINFVNTSGLIEYIVNTNSKQLASWGTLTATIVKELSSGFKKIDLKQKKLSAWMPVAKSMLDLGPVWLDRYVRVVLAEALAYGLEDAIINGTGKDCPIGMARQVGDNVTVTGGVYPEKTAVEVTSFDPESYGSIISGLAVTPNGNYRTVSEVIMIVNPVDYLKKVMPATTVLRPDGTYANNVVPFPTKFIQSAQIASGKAVIGIAKRYFMGIGTEKSGKIDYDDSYKFLEDERTYLVKLYGHGEPLDNNAFAVLDISKLKPASYRVKLESDSTVNP